MSNDRSRKRGAEIRTSPVFLVLAVAAWVSAVSVWAGEAPGTRHVQPRELVRTVASKYAVWQGDKEIGSETVTRSDFSDNSVQFQAVIALQFQQVSEMTIETDLLLEEESYFPIRYAMAKHVKQGEINFDITVDIDWFSNVAVIRKTTRGTADSTSMVLPTGTAVLDINAAHHLYVPLYWYDREQGGYQSFNLVDPITTKLIAATLRFQLNEITSVAGQEIAADRYEFVRDKQSFKVYVGDGGRILKVDQGFMVYELVQYAETTARKSTK